MEFTLFSKKITLPKQWYWREILAVLFLMIGIYFFRQQRHEVSTILPFLHTASKSWLLTAAIITVVYILFQSGMYMFSFRAIGQRVSLTLCIELFLKRSFLSVFLPGGGVSSLAYTPNNIKREVKDTLTIYQASALFGFAGVLSTFVISLVVIVSTIGSKQNIEGTEFGLVLLAILIALLFYLMYAVRKEKKIFRWLRSKYPKAASRISEVAGVSVSSGFYTAAIFCSLGVEVCGIAHLYISMLAVGVRPSLEAAGLAYVISVLLSVASPFLKGVGAVELSVTYILGSFGFLPVQALAITLIYRTFEFWLPLVLGLFSFLIKGRQLFLRLFPSFFIFLLGIINILSVLTPPLADRIRVIRRFLPSFTIHTTNTLVIYIGVTLVATAAYLVRGLRNAWWIAVVCTILSLVGHLFKGLDWEEASLALLVLLSLWFTRKEYTARTNPKLISRAATISLLTFIALLVYGYIGFYFLEKKHFNTDFSRYQSLKNTFLIFLLQKTDLDPVTEFGTQFLISMYVFALAAWVFLLYAFIKPYISLSRQNKEQLQAVQLLEKYGDSAVDFFKVAPDKSFFFSKTTDAFVAYRMERGFAIVLHEPVCAKDSKAAVLNEFSNYCNKAGLKAAYYRVDEHTLSLFEPFNKKRLLIGQEAIADVQGFDLAGRDKKALRNSLNSLQKKGFKTAVFPAPHNDEFIKALQGVSNQWLAAYDREELIFSQGRFDSELLRGQDLVVTTDGENKPVAFLNVIPDYAPDECTYDLIRKTADAPGGCMDALIIELIKYAKEKGYRYLNLGLAPMSGLESAETTVEKVMKYAYQKIKRFQHYRGLRSFKEKYASHWQNKYLVYDNDFDLIRLPAALNKAMKPLYEK